MLDWQNKAGTHHYHIWSANPATWNAKAFEEACEEFGVDKLEALVNNILPEEEEKNSKKRNIENETSPNNNAKKKKQVKIN